MATSVGLAVGEFRYIEHFEMGKHLVVLVGEIDQGCVAREMLLQLRGGGRSPVLGVEAYGKGGDLKYGLLVHADVVDDALEGALKPGEVIFVMQHVPIARSHKESTFHEMAVLAEAVNETNKLDSPS